MRYVHVFAFLFLAIFLVLTAAVGFGWVIANPTIAAIINFSALVAGILYFVGVVKYSTGCCCHEVCEHKEIIEKK